MVHGQANRRHTPSVSHHFPRFSFAFTNDSTLPSSCPTLVAKRGFRRLFFFLLLPSLFSPLPIEDRSYRVGAIFVRCKLFGSGRATLATLNLVKISGWRSLIRLNFFSLDSFEEIGFCLRFNSFSLSKRMRISDWFELVWARLIRCKEVNAWSIIWENCTYVEGKNVSRRRKVLKAV